MDQAAPSPNPAASSRQDAPSSALLVADPTFHAVSDPKPDSPDDFSKMLSDLQASPEAATNRGNQALTLRAAAQQEPNELLPASAAKSQKPVNPGTGTRPLIFPSLGDALARAAFGSSATPPEPGRFPNHEPADQKLPPADPGVPQPAVNAATAPAGSPQAPVPVAEDPKPVPDSPVSAGLETLLESKLQSLSDAAHAGPPLPEIAFGARLIARSGADGAARPVVPAPGLSSDGDATVPAVSAAADASSGQSGEEARSASRTEHPVLPATPSQPADGQPVQAPGAALSVASTAQPADTRSTTTATTRNSETGSTAAQSGQGPASPDMPTTGAARDIALRLSADDNSAVEVRLSEHAGEVRVVVRSADPQMAESVRAQLPELMDKLGARGFETEIWRPQQSSATERGGSESNPQSGSRDGGRDAQQERSGRDGRQSGEEPQPKWMEELATSFHPPKPSNRSNIL